MKRFLAMVLMCSNTGLAAAQISVSEAWIQAAPPTVSMFAGYLIIENQDPTDATIERFESPRFGAIEMHHTMMKEGMAEMMHQKSFQVPANGMLKLEPHGRHLMLLEPTSPLKLGEEISFKVVAHDGRETTFTAIVKKPTVE